MKKSVLAFCLCFINLGTFADGGMSAFNRKDYNEAYRVWSRAPDKPESQYGLGRLHYEGLGGPRNADKGISLLRASSEKGYRPATEYLANLFEKNNDSRNAVRFLERLQAQEKTLKNQERLVAAHRALSKPLPSKSQDYCQALNEFSKLGGIPEAGAAEMCALNGLSSPVSPTDARKWLTTNFSRNPTIDGLEMVVEEALNPKAQNFDPQVIEEAVWRLDPALSNTSIKRMLLEKGRVSQEICRTLPFREQEQRARFSAYCTLAVISGANRNPLVVAREYVSGGQTRAGMRTSERVERGLALLKLAPDVFASLDGLHVRMEADRARDSWRKLFETIIENEKSLFNPMTNEARAAVIYLFRKADTRSGTPDFGQEDALKLAQVVQKLAEDQDTKKQACLTLSPFDSEKFTNPQDTEMVTRKALAKSLDEICSVVAVTRPDPKQLNDPGSGRSTSPTVIPPGSPPTMDLRRPSDTNPVPQGSGSTGSNFEKSLSDCNSGVVSQCGPAAINLLSSNPSPLFASLPRDQRVVIAEKLLLKGVEKDDIQSLSVLFDLYDTGLDSEKRVVAQKYLNTLLAKGEPAGFLRKEIQSLPRDPLSGLLGGTLLRTQTADKCKKIKGFADDARLSAHDKKLARDTFDGLMCSSVR